MIDHYRVLEVDPAASPEVVEKAYRALCLKYHPDRQPLERRASSTRAMQKLNASYAVLSDPARRSAYDASYLKHRHADDEEARMFRVFLDDGLIGIFKSWVKQGME